MPRTAGPGLGPAHPFFLDARRGYVATTGGAWYVPKTGVQPPVVPAEIDVTSDGGANWRVLVREPHAAFDAVTFSGRLGYALGARVGVHRAPGPAGHLVTFALATSDGGASWHEVAAPFSGSAGAYSVPGAIPVALQPFARIVFAELAGRAKRTRDGGRRWVGIAVPRGTTLVRFASPLIGFAGVAAGCRGGETLWRTTDAGQSWRPLAGTCGPGFTDIEAHGRVVATAQASSVMSGGGERSLLRLSLDGGKSWRIVADRPWRAVAFVSFTDARHGWAVSAENDQGFQYDQLHVTVNGGRTWATRPQPFAPVTQFGPAPTQPAFGGASIWAGEPEDGLLWHSRDRGGSWTVVSQPQYLGLRRLIAVQSRTLIVDTDASALRSDNGGRSWQPVRQPTPRKTATVAGAISYLAQTDDGLEGVAYLRARRRWRRLHPPTLGVGAVAFADARDGAVASGQGDGYGRAPVAATTDGGHSWRAIRLPLGVHRGDHAVLGPGVIVLVEPPTLYVTLDQGRHWRRLPVPRDIFDCNATNVGGHLWLACGGPGSGPTLLLRSSDGGHTWNLRRTPLMLTVTPVGPSEAWATTSAASFVGRPQPLWHTTDGGHVWNAIWPRLASGTPIPFTRR